MEVIELAYPMGRLFSNPILAYGTHARPYCLPRHVSRVEFEDVFYGLGSVGRDALLGGVPGGWFYVPVEICMLFLLDRPLNQPLLRRICRRHPTLLLLLST